MSVTWGQVKVVVIPGAGGLHFTRLSARIQLKHNVHRVPLPWDADLRRPNQAKILKNRWFYFWLLNMTMWCKHVHRLELFFFYNFCAAHLSVRLDIETKFPISYFGHACPKWEIGNFGSISHLTGKCVAQQFKNFCSSSIYIYKSPFQVKKGETR